jgi:hypothetical protein
VGRQRVDYELTANGRRQADDRHVGEVGMKQAADERGDEQVTGGRCGGGR